MDFAPESGWSAPLIKPYGPMTLDPACSVFHYTPALFEGMEVRRFWPYYPIEDRSHSRYEGNDLFVVECRHRPNSNNSCL